MINVNFNSVKSTLASFGVHFNFNLNKENSVNKDEHKDLGSEELISPVDKKLTDYKTTLSGYSIGSLEISAQKITLHFFIDDKPITAWNLVTPIIELHDTSEYILFGRSYFAFQGTGGGISNIRKLFWKMERLINEGVEVSISAKVIDIDVIEKFYYHDGDITLEQLKLNSTPLVNYQKDQFEYIHKKNQELKKGINCQNVSSSKRF